MEPNALMLDKVSTVLLLGDATGPLSLMGAFRGTCCSPLTLGVKDPSSGTMDIIGSLTLWCLWNVWKGLI